MDKSLLNKNSLEMTFPVFFCFVLPIILENALEENYHTGCGN